MSDQNRPLNSRGVAAAGRMGRFVARAGVVPDVVLSSPAVRARTTAELAVGAGEWDRDVEIRAEFYGAGAEAVLEVLQGLPSEIGSAVIIGHEPVWSSLVGALTGGGRVRFPTAALACLRLEVRWSAVDRGVADLLWMVTPKLLERAT